MKMKNVNRVLFYSLLGLLLGIVVTGGEMEAVIGAVAAPTMAQFAQMPINTLASGMAGMVTMKSLQEERAALVKELEGLTEKADSEKRDLTDEESTEFDNKRSELEKLDKRISRQKLLDEERAAKAAKNGQPTGVGNKEEKELKNYSFLKAIRSQLNGQALDGLEAEMHQEALKEARESGLTIEGVGVPSMLMQKRGEKRDMVVGTTTAGGHTVETEVGELIPALRPSLMVEALGARMLTGLTGNIDLPRNNGVGTAVWAAEQADATETTPSFDKISLSPKRLAAFTNYSKQLLAQSSLGVERFVREDLEMAIQTAVDAAAINGSGSSSQPEGILNTSGIGDVAMGTNGAVPTFNSLVDLESEVATENALDGNLAYLSTPGIRGVLKKTKIDAGSGIMVMGQDSRLVNGYRAEFSTQVPSNLTKGTADAIAHAIIFGNWTELVVANWAGVDIVVDPYTLAKKGSVQVTVNSFWDIAVRQAKAFAAIKDALLS